MTWGYSGKLTDPLTLKPGVAQTVAEVGPCPRDGFALVAGNVKLHLVAAKPVKFDVWLLRVNANDPTCYNSHTFPGGEDDFFAWPVWIGEVAEDETYRWILRLRSGLTGTLTTRYAKSKLLPPS